MALEARLSQKLGLGLKMTPQLQQAIKLLQFGQPEFVDAISEEILKNPLLERVDEFEAPTPTSVREQATSSELHSSGETPAQPSAESGTVEIKSKGDESAEFEKYLEDYTDWRGAATPKGLIDHDDMPSIEATAHKDHTLVDHLVEQLRMLDIDDMQKRVALSIIGNLNEDGYLCASPEEIAQELNTPADEVSDVLSIVQSLEPAGVGARNLSECLLIQLDSLGLDSGLESKIIREHLEKLEKRKFDQIAKTENVAVDDVYKAVMTIRKLEPKPGRNFPSEDVRYVTPDIYVTKVGNDWVITMNEDGLPKLRVSPYYLSVLRSEGNSEQKSYLTERLRAATWLIKSIHQRQNTIYKVTESIVKFQREFLELGIERLKPLTLKEVADDIGMHESTVSRVTSNKFVHTSQGVFELKYFFTSAIKSGQGDMSSFAVKERIKQLVAAETAGKPLSDQQLVEILKKEGIDIARRTVAKYREALGIPSSSLRASPLPPA